MLNSSLHLPVPESGRLEAEQYVAEHFAGLYLEDEVVSSDRFRGGQAAADSALARFDVSGYAKNRNEAYPEPRRGASGLSPYIRHGLLSLRRTWDAVSDGPEPDRDKFRDELLWQEYARHWYARLGPATAHPLRRRLLVDENIQPPGWDQERQPPGWDQDMACLELTIDELEEDGYLVNQTRMWLASHWAVRNGLPWRAGEDYFFQHLLDGSRAANRLGWQWTAGIGSNRAYGFSRWQVERRAPGLCASCEVAANCPIYSWPDEAPSEKVDVNPLIAADPDLDATRGPQWPTSTGSPDGVEVNAVWLTAESLGHADPALVVNPDVPAVFVFDRALLTHLQLSSKRLTFLVETLSELSLHRPVEIHLGDPVSVLANRSVATTFAPVPGWRTRAAKIEPVQVHPWPWLRFPIAGSIGSFSAWHKQVSNRR